MNGTECKIGTVEYMVRVAAIMLGAVVVLFCAKIWIVDPLVKAAPQKAAAAAPEPAETAARRDWDKTKYRIKWQDAEKYLDKYVETEGVIVSSYKAAKVTYLNFDKNYRETLSLVIFSSAYKRFPASPEKHYLNKNVKVEGRIKEYKGRLEIVLGSAEQIKITGGDN